MLDMLKARKEQLEERGVKGFTLMEMLIVIAIIAILIAIAIPIFSAQLETARDATSVANIRSAYAEAQTAYITYNTTTFASATDKGNVTNFEDVTGEGGAVTGKRITISPVRIETQQGNQWSGQGGDVSFVGNGTGAISKDAFAGLDTGTTIQGDCSVAFTYNGSGVVTGLTITKNS